MFHSNLVTTLALAAALILPMTLVADDTAAKKDAAAPTDAKAAKKEVKMDAKADAKKAATKTASVTELKKEDVTKGRGKEAVSGKKVSVHYTGWLTDGTKFDSSVGRGPFTFVLGSGQVIPGWDQGVAGMKVGGKRKLTIPPTLAYGANGVPGAIPPDSTLVFDVELLDVN